MKPISRRACFVCEHILRQQQSSHRRGLASLIQRAAANNPVVRHRPTFTRNTQTRPARAVATTFRQQVEKKKRRLPAAQSIDQKAEDDALFAPVPPVDWAEAELLVKRLLSRTDTIPSEEDALQAMRACQYLAKQLAGHEDANARTPLDQSTKSSLDGSASSLLSLDDRSKHPASQPLTPDQISKLAYSLIQHPPVFITPALLASYVATQSLLREPSTLPEAFHLYAHKPVPKPGTSPPEYTTPNPNDRRAAVPVDTASLALAAAIKTKDLELCLDIITTSFRTLAFRRNKFVTQALPPLLAVVGAPLGAYFLATNLVNMAPSPETAAASPEAMTLALSLGALTYVGAVASMGFIALSTANDQMYRVTWASGTPLSERWMRESERAAMDRLVQAWGFSEVWKRGEEEGEEWDYLKEWIGERGAVVDKVELMEGME